MTLLLRTLQAEDAEAVLRIYGEGMATGHATFQADVPNWQEWEAGHLPECRWVADEDNAILGWAALSGVSSRCVYAGVAEVSLYVSASAQGRGVGSRLLERLVTSSEDAGIWTLQAGIFPENTVSLRLHERYDFERLGVRKRLGKMTYGPLAGQWRDVVLLERRSQRVGV
ncbi:MAG: GNAT family N-acetyltransferase [SAR324 cluster bacterium]|nr:GNAT family N-acetyltransferase [SAR324 cluster bacterium]